jgi:hypothetical protein
LTVDPIAQQLGVGGTFGVIFAYILLKFKPWQVRNGNSNGNGYSNPRSDKADLVEYGKLSQKVDTHDSALTKLTEIVETTAKTVQNLTGSVETLTELMKRR